MSFDVRAFFFLCVFRVDVREDKAPPDNDGGARWGGGWRFEEVLVSGGWGC